MASTKDDRFEPKLGRSKSRGKSSQKFISRVLRAASKAGPVSRMGLARKHAAGALRGRGQVVARLVGDCVSATSRRVAVKARLVNLKRAPAGSAIAHLRFIERDGVTPEGELGQAYGPNEERADINEFEKRGAGIAINTRDFDIVAPERPAAPIVGRVAAKGLSDELHDRRYLIIDGIDGQAHFLVLPSCTDALELPIWAIVDVRANDRTASRSNRREAR